MLFIYNFVIFLLIVFTFIIICKYNVFVFFSIELIVLLLFFLECVVKINWILKNIKAQIKKKVCLKK